jgi:hypothetical protein
MSGTSGWILHPNTREQRLLGHAYLEEVSLGEDDLVTMRVSRRSRSLDRGALEQTRHVCWLSKDGEDEKPARHGRFLFLLVF